MEEQALSQQKEKKSKKKLWWLVLIPIAIIIIVAAILGSGNGYPNDLIDLPEAEYKAQCQVYDYEDIARNPEAYNKKLAKFTGEVIQVLRDDDIYELRVNVTLYGTTITYYLDTMYVYYKSSSETRILEGDIITMYGELRETQTYTSVVGIEVEIPRIYVKFIEYSE